MGFEVHQVPAAGAEDVVVGDDGAVHTGTEDGSIFRIRHDGQRIDRVAHTGGRPLGLETLPDGRLLVCDARKGLLKVDPATGAIESTVAEVAGRAMMFCNNAAVQNDGTVWFSDSSKLYSLEKWKNDLVENTRTGRLLKFTEDGTLSVALDGLAFANGVALAQDESYVAVAETGARTVVRLWLSGPSAGTRDFLVADLPGYPDNIARGSDGLIWVTIASPTDPVVERLQNAPLPLRKAVSRIPDKLQPKPKRTIRVQAFDDAGLVVHDIDLKDDRFHMVTGVREYDGRVWMGSLHEPAVAVLTL